MSSCGAPLQGSTAVLTPGATLIEGCVSTGTAPVAGAYVRLHDATGEFTAEVIASPDGDFRFYAAPGTWEIRVLSRSGNATQTVTVAVGINRAEITLP